MATVSPDPTLSALSTITPPAELSSLNNGGLSDVCGYVSGKSETPWTCPDNGTCRYNKPSAAAGCCWSEPCTVISACHDYAASGDGKCHKDSLGVGTTCCESPDTPYCQTWSYSDISASLVWCTDEPPTAQVVIFNQPVSVTADSSTLADGTVSTVIVSNTLTEDVSAPTAATEKKSRSLSTPGIIALSVVLSIAAIGALAFWLFRRFKKRKTREAELRRTPMYT